MKLLKRTLMFRRVRLVLVFWVLSFVPALSADFHAVATIDPAISRATQTSAQLDLTLGLSKSVPYRVFTLANPDRLVLDMKEVDWRGLPKEAFVHETAVRDLRYGLFRPGWSRMVVELSKPMVVNSAELDTSPESPRLMISLVPSSREDFDAVSQFPKVKNWLHAKPRPDLAEKHGLRIVVDPGHGGVDPGAVREGVQEKDIALSFSLELKQILEQSTGIEVVLTRDADYSVSLGDRVRFARDASADLFLSIHSNTVTRGDASGASVYTLSNRASDAASAQLAELENRADISVGIGDHVEGDDVAKVLVDLARVDTNARSKLFAASLISELDESVGVLRTKPHRSAGFKVLKAHDIPSVLLELGFMSNAADRKNMQDKAWRRDAAISVTKAIEAWVTHDEERSKLVLK